MAVTNITNTRDGKAAIRYAYEEPSHKQGMDRVLAARGHNLDTNFAMQQMRATWDAHGKNDGKNVQMYRIIQSFGDNELTADNPSDIDKANEIGHAIASELYPDRQALVVTQADGDGGKLHNHVLINSVDFVSGKSLGRGRTGWQQVSAKSDEVIQRYGITPLQSTQAKSNTSMAVRKLTEQGKYTWVGDLQGRIEQTLEDDTVTTHDAFAHRMRDDYDVDVHYRGKNGISYAFTDDEGKQRRIRGGKLGTDYQKDNIQDVFAKNEQSQQQKQASPSYVVDGLGIDFGAELAKIDDERTPTPKRRRASTQEAPIQKEVRLEREARERAERIDSAHADALIDNAHYDALVEDDIWEQERVERERREEEQERLRMEAEERRRKEAQRKAQEAERRRQVELRRQRTMKRIKEFTVPPERQGITGVFLDKFADNQKAMIGKTYTGLGGKQVPYNDGDVLKRTKRQMSDRGQDVQKQAPQHVVEQEQEAPEL